MSRTSITAVAAAAVATITVGGLASTGVSHAAPARAGSSHRLSFTSRTLASRQVGSAGLIETDKAVKDGAVIGYTANSCTFDFAAEKAHCLVTLARPRGQLRTRVTVDNASGSVRGSVVGGSGVYAGATGTVTGQATGQSTVTITLRWTD